MAKFEESIFDFILEEEIFAYIRYEGELVKEGYLDARKSGEALIGTDEMLRYFIFQEFPEIKNFEFELPVRVRKGSWEIIFPENIEGLAAGGFAAWMAGKYLGSALEEIAKNDFKDVSFKQIIRKSFENIVAVIKLAKHLGSLSKKKFEHVTFSEENDLIKIMNDTGQEIWVPIELLEIYTHCPQTIFNKISKIVEEERELTIGVFSEEDNFTEEKITSKSKYIFSKNEDEDDIILPELQNGEYVELNGHVTRGNEKSNTIGFLYQGHIITCYPDIGNIKNQKSKLFNNCVLKGYVDRIDKEGNIIEKRPRIKFIEIVNMDKPSQSLFD